MSRWKNIKEALYNLIDGKNPTDDGYNYTWGTGRRSDRIQDTIASITNGTPDATLIIEYPTNGLPFESDVTQSAGGVDSLHRRKRRRVWLIARVESKLAEALDEEAIDANNDALDDALQDIERRAFNGTIEPTLCAEGVKRVQYINSFKRQLTAGDIYYPYELQVVYDIDYVEPI